MKNRNHSKQRRQYDEEFRQNALQLIADGRSVDSVSESLGISKGVLYNWRSKAKKSSSSENASETNEEVQLLRKRLAEVEMERDILKKALGIFSRTR